MYKKIIAITTITTIGAAGMANAQTTTSEISRTIFQQAMSLFKSGNSQEAKNLLAQSGVKPFGGTMHAKHADRINKRVDKNTQKKMIEDAIISGNFANFQLVASTSPLKGLTKETFNLLTPQFSAKKSAEDQIKSILTNAGITVPDRK